MREEVREALTIFGFIATVLSLIAWAIRETFGIPLAIFILVGVPIVLFLLEGIYCCLEKALAWTLRKLFKPNTEVEK